MTQFVFVSENDTDLGKVLKSRRLNPIGEDAYLMPDGSVTLDEDKIVAAQRIFKHNYYKPGGKGSCEVLKKYKSCDAQFQGLY